MYIKFQSFSNFFLAGMLACFLHSSTVHAAWQQPPHEFAPARFYPIAVASDATGHAIALPNSDSPRAMLASFYSSGVWSDPPTVIGAEAPLKVDLAMDNGGTALAIWLELTGDIRTAFFDGTNWSTPSPDPLDTAISLGFLSVAMNGPNSGVAMWIDFTTQTVRSSFFLAGAWSLPITIGTGDFVASIAYSTNGTVVAGWFDLAGGTKVNNYTGGSWQGEIVLDPTGTSGAAVGIDSTGKALAVWLDATGNVVTSTFNGISWSLSQVISVTPAINFPTIGMTPNGTAVAAWVDNTNAGFSSSYNGAAWSGPILITAGPISSAYGTQLSLSVADNGNALAVWATVTEIRSARLPLGGVWSAEELVATLSVIDSNNVHLVDSSLSEDGTGFAAWGIDIEGRQAQFASAELPPLPPIPTPPTNLQGFTCTDKFASQSDRVNTLIWIPSADPTIVAYNLRRNGVLIATIPALAPNIYRDHNRCKVIDVYTLTSVDGIGVESAPITIELF